MNARNDRRRGRFLAAGSAVFGVAALLTGAISASGFAATVTGPGQPASGPGGAAYPWSTYSVQHATFSDATKDYWAYEPAGWKGDGARPSKVPLVVFLHGWSADDPKYYIDWITHLVRKGNVLIFPRYQSSTATPPSSFTPNAISSIKKALAKLKNAKVKPTTDKGMTLVSHSWGGPVSADIANRWAKNALPKPTSIFFAEPYDRTIDASLEGIPPTTKMDCLVGDVDTTAGRTGCDVLWDRTGQIPAKNRDYVWMFSDAHGTPALTADHRAPSSNNADAHLDALDYYGFWKLGDALRDCAVNGTNCAYALGGTAKQTNMGTWSDGQQVKRLSVTTTKPACPPNSGAKGC